ncbi:MAG: thioredoxin domain-containing protein [Kofleriaceae bacterium]|nr:thioredoxin domain-containing protein [Kofleriaceae bacterium]
MGKRFLGVVALVAAVIGLGASIASLVDYFGAEPTFCAESGCATVRASAWAHPLGIPMPVIGIVYFTLMIVLAFAARPRVRMLLGALGGAAAIGLIVLQGAVIGSWCKLCMVADPAAIVSAIAVLAGAATLRLTWRASALLPALALVVLSLGLWTHAELSDLPRNAPPSVMAEQRPGMVTIVEYVDFECPFCRALDKKLSEALAKTKRKVRIVRRMVPLPSHAHAVPAAMAWCAADAQGKGEAMAKALFAAAPETLTPAGCEALAVALGCDVMKYRETFASAELRARIEGDIADARAAGLEGFPPIFIGTQRFEGSDHSAATLLAAIERGEGR